MSTGTRAVALFVLALTLAGCTETAREPLGPDTTISVAEGATPTATGAPTGRTGNVVKQIDQWAMLLDLNGNESVKFKVTKIDTDYACTDGRTPKNGRFIGIWMDIYTAEGAVLGAGDPLYFNTTDWRISSPGGAEEESAVVVDAACAGADALPVQLLAGQHEQGVVVLDAALAHGVLALVPEYVTGGWEWNF